ncbi:hypothetical protein [Marinobacter salarius]|uniref:hypothetical protein n=1 Tax=Marinobacter salarius TaxID=1420917 RepID=UPI0012FAA83F|nr:hypothetical protein [Marinobacter salarius]
MTRYRSSGWPTANGHTSHCTIDSGDGSFQTAITFRSWDGGCDLAVVARPEPKRGVSGDDKGESVRWRP